VKHLEALIADGGSISIGALDDLECVAAASDAHNSLAMLVRRDGETLAALLKPMATSSTKSTRNATD
jgi:hypothetical protein